MLSSVSKRLNHPWIASLFSVAAGLLVLGWIAEAMGAGSGLLSGFLLLFGLLIAALGVIGYVGLFSFKLGLSLYEKHQLGEL